MSPETLETGYESRDAAPRPLYRFTAGLTLLIVAVFAVSAWLDRVFAARIEAERSVHPMAEFRAAPSGPLLQAAPAAELERRRAEEGATLATYGWIDREQGLVRIPIERAMELALERGFPVSESEGGGR